MSQALDKLNLQLKNSNFEFMKLDNELSSLYGIAKQVEFDYAIHFYDNIPVNVKKIVENLMEIIIDANYDVIPRKADFSEKLSIINEPKYTIREEIIDIFYDLDINFAVFSEVDIEVAHKYLSQLRHILYWYMEVYTDVKIKRVPLIEPQVISIFKNNQERKIIYVQTADNSNGDWMAYEGAEKIGETTAPEEDIEEDWSPNSDFLRKVTRRRINSYMRTAGVPSKIDWAELAWKKETKSWFGDKDVHEVLLRSGHERKKGLEGTEWFEVSLETAKEAIKAVKEGRSSIKDTLKPSQSKIILRSEQEAAVKQATKAFKNHQKVLWNAKMRFGKTLSTYELIKRNKYQKVLVMTHRPVVSDSWYEDFKKINMPEAGYEYASKNMGEKNLGKLIDDNAQFIYFVSIQDLRGAIEAGGKFDKNSEFFAADWDLIVVDEAHEGTQTERGDKLYENLIKENTKILELSGTPFNILSDFTEDQVFTWDYIMEQQAKIRFAVEHPDKVNPYEMLPEVEMYTFEMDIKNKFQNMDKYFDFSEFFRVSDDGDFVYKESILNWLDQITSDGKTFYPFSTEDLRESIRHTLWLLPSRASAKALKELLGNHTIFKEYTVLNIVNDNDDTSIEVNSKDMKRVRDAITDKPSETKTIILTVRKLTTGVNIPALNAVMFLNNTTSAQSYLQAAFRAQTPFADEVLGIKKKAYIFDFAPDRALNILAKSVSMSPKAGALNTNGRKEKLGDLLNFLPVLGQQGNVMKPYSISTMMRQLKKAYAEKAVMSGFDDASIYNDELWNVAKEEALLFNEISSKLGKTKQSKKTKKVDVNRTGLDEQEREMARRANRKPKKERTTEEEAAIEREKKFRKERSNMIDILRGVSIRIPLMIYGMERNLNEDITLDDFVNLVDQVSWEEFMPQGITKADFVKLKKFYDPEIFIEAGHRIRQAAVSANNLSYQDRIEKITSIFSGFKNPDKETVLTPWRVVNMQLGETVGGFNFYDEDYKDTLENGLYREIDNGHITAQCFSKEAKILEINSKTGLYPLYMAFNIYQRRYLIESEKWSKTEYVQKDKELWQNVLENNIFALNKTPMARTITYRTLNGYEKNEKFMKNLVYIEDLPQKIKNNLENTADEINKEFGGFKVEFDAIVGNPPYQEMDGGAKASAAPTYHHFVQMAKLLNPEYISMIMPSRWYVGGKGLDKFREEMLNDKHLCELYDWLTPEDIFPNTNIRGGICYFLWDKNYNNLENLTRVVSYEKGKKINDVIRPFKISGINIFIRDAIGVDILKKVFPILNENFLSQNSMMKYVSPAKAFGFRGFFVKDEKFRSNDAGLKSPVKCYGLKGAVGFVEREEVNARKEWIDNWKVLTAESNNIGTELNDDNLNTIIAGPATVCTETYVVVGADLNLDKDAAKSLSKFMQTKFFRYLHSLAKSSQHGTRSTYRFIPIQNFQSSSDINWAGSISEIDKQLNIKYNLTPSEIKHIENKIKSMI